MLAARRPGPMGRAMLILLRLTSVALVLAVVGLLVPSALLLYPQPPQLQLPMGAQDITPRFDVATGIVHIQGNVTITVGGIYDIEDMVFLISLRDHTGWEVVNATQGPFTVQPNRAQRQHLDLAVDLSRWMAQGANPLLQGDNLTLRLGLQALYTAGFVRVVGSLGLTMPWNPPITNLAVDTANATTSTGGSTVTWSVPYTVETAGYLSGGATVRVTLSNSTATVASNATNVPLGGRATGVMNFTMPTAAATANSGRTLTLTTTVSLPGGLTATTTRQITWSYP